jgi:3-hydroxybutyryl-CoA dehydratase
VQHAIAGPGAVRLAQMLKFRAPVKIGETVEVTVAVAELFPERRRAQLTCICRVGNDIVRGDW